MIRRTGVDGLWTGWEIAWEEARDGGARLKGMIRWTGCGRAGAAEIAWEEARDGGARLKGMIRWRRRGLCMCQRMSHRRGKCKRC